MASVKQLLSDNLRCPICHDLFSKPRLLPCSHSFCHDCLYQLHSVQNRWEQISCPVCRRVIAVPRNNVSNFPTNQIVQSLADDFKKGSEKKRRTKGQQNSCGQSCTVCDADDQDVATFYCQNCSEFLCDNCVQQHKKYKQNAFHELVKATDIRTGIVKMQIACPKHPRELQEYVCISCMERICCRCFEVEHEFDGHEVIEMAEYEESQKGAFEILQEKIEQKSGVIQSHLSYVEEKLREVRSIVGQRKQDIENTYDVATGQLQRRRYELLEICNLHEDRWCQELEGIIECHYNSLEIIAGKASLVNEKINRLYQPDQSLSEHAAQVNGLETILQGDPLRSFLPTSAYIAQSAEFLTFQRSPETNAFHLGTVYLKENAITESTETHGAEAASSTPTQNKGVIFDPRNEEITLSFAQSQLVQPRTDSHLIQSRTYDRVPRRGLFSSLFTRMLRRSPDLSEYT